MDNRTDIWRLLQDHAVLPSPEASARVREAIHAASLQHHSITPPVSLRSAIGRIINLKQPPQGRLRRLLDPPGNRQWVYGAAAACFILLIAGIVIYRIAFTGQLHNAPASSITAAKPTQPAANPLADTAVARDTVTNALALANEDTIAGKTDSTAVATTVRLGHLSSMSFEGHSIPLADNDLLFTFTSYRYPELSGYINKIGDHELKVHLDQYTNIVISKPLVDMIKQVYDTRSNGKPSRKARKAKGRLEDWKKADEKRFDNSNSSDPIDPIDLAEFIFR